MAVCPSCGQENADGARFCNACAAPLGAEPAAEVRKTVTVLFCDLVGSTALGERTDPELLRELMARYHAELRQILERHGGTVEKFVGDAAMAVFGIPQVHEDDALRAVRAAFEIRDAVAGLDLEARIGVNTGEVVAGIGETLVTGDAVNVAARLEQAARSGEILLGPATQRLVHDAVRTENVEPLNLKGKAEPVPAHRLLELLPDVPAFTRRLDSLFVGRSEELAALERAVAGAIEARSPQLATIVGPPGIGKSRLARELIQRSPANLLVARCLSYGEGITYWPLAEIVAQVRDVRVALADDPDAELAASRVAAALGTAEAPASSEEIAWGFRKLFEALARAKPLIVVLDDIHWAEPTLLDLIEYVVTFAQDAPLFLLCMARPDLLELRPAWVTPKPNTTLVALDPLANAETETLVEALGDVPDRTKARIVKAADGNPLFVEQLVAMQADSGNSDLEVPPTIQALLSARIDRLETEERAVVERASVEGRLFHRGSVAELLPEQVRPQVGSHLLTLVRKEFIRPDRATLPGDDGFRFAHILIRDAAYDSIPKKLRAELHERFADWLQSRLGDEAPDEILGYHLERAYRYRQELRSVDDHAGRIAARAASHLRSAGERAYSRDDMPAAVNLLERALALPWTDMESGRVEVRLRLASALLDVGRPTDAEAATEEAAIEAEAAGDRPGELRAALFRGQIAIWTTNDYGTLLPLAEQALPLFEAAGDDRGSMDAWRVIAAASERLSDAADAYGHALVHARRLGSHVDEREILGWLEFTLFLGSTPVREILRWAEDCSLPLDELEPAVTVLRAVLLTMDGRLAEARELCARGEARAQELGIRLWMAANAELAWEIEMLAGDYVAADQQARRGYELYDEMNSRVGLGLCAGQLAEALCGQKRYDEAAHWADVCEENTGSDGIVWRQ
ncbi:MAG: AAA family ATPase, partial [Actinomycetota bacterium]|nr:AAA family ATPase [Actinomycetota bacterium]